MQVLHLYLPFGSPEVFSCSPCCSGCVRRAQRKAKRSANRHIGLQSFGLAEGVGSARDSAIFGTSCRQHPNDHTGFDELAIRPQRLPGLMPIVMAQRPLALPVFTAKHVLEALPRTSIPSRAGIWSGCCLTARIFPKTKCHLGPMARILCLISVLENNSIEICCFSWSVLRRRPNKQTHEQFDRQQRLGNLPPAN
jgi:hypothetical protein